MAGMTPQGRESRPPIDAEVHGGLREPFYPHSPRTQQFEFNSMQNAAGLQKIKAERSNMSTN